MILIVAHPKKHIMSRQEEGEWIYEKEKEGER
jgi:hypothetical protein